MGSQEVTVAVGGDDHVAQLERTHLLRRRAESEVDGQPRQVPAQKGDYGVGRVRQVGQHPPVSLRVPVGFVAHELGLPHAATSSVNRRVRPSSTWRKSWWLGRPTKGSGEASAMSDWRAAGSRSSARSCWFNR